MVEVAALLSVVLAGWLVFVQPLAGRRRYQRLLELLERDPSARLAHYRRGLAGEWIGAGIVGLLALLAPSRMRSLWPAGTDPDAAEQLPVAVIVLLLVSVAYRIFGYDIGRALAGQLKPVVALLPRTRLERRAFAGLAVSAGICEEVIYRGFGLAALRWAFPDASDGLLIGISSGAFGIAHLYQGAPGVALTGLLGAYFAWFTIATGSLLPAMLLHALVDLRILGLPLDAIPDPIAVDGSDDGPPHGPSATSR